MPANRPLVIAHRGASGYRPEHTLAAYALAIAQGADVIEPDLVVTRDGVLIARHENEISGTTDVADHAEFADRRTTKSVDGTATTGWFAEDFSLAEIKTLRARERLPQLRPASAAYDATFDIPTLAEVIALVQQAPRPVAIYPETKHPTYFAQEGRYLDGSPIQQSLGRLLVAELVRTGFTVGERVYIQSFELANLIELKQHIMPAAHVDLRLMQLFGDLQPASTGTTDDFSIPYDIRWHVQQGDDLDTHYPGLAQVLPQGLRATTRYAELTTPAALTWMRRHYAYGIAPWKDNLLLRRVATAGAPAQLNGAVLPVVAAARHAGLHVHTYTLRAESEFLSRDESGATLTMEQEIERLLDAGIDGYFTDQPDRGVSARDDWWQRR